jgi:outer membrane protein
MKVVMTSFSKLNMFVATPTRLLGLLVLLASVGFVGAAQAQSKIGFVNTDRIFRDSPQAKAAQTKLEAEFSKRQKELQDQAARLKTSSEKFEKDSPTLSEAERNKRQKDLLEQDRDLQRRDRELREDFNTRRNEELQAVLERANRVVRDVAQQEKYDIVFQEAVYVNPAIDITEKVLKVLNAAAK